MKHFILSHNRFSHVLKLSFLERLYGVFRSKVYIRLIREDEES